MTKINILGANGNKEREISTTIFDGRVRADIVQKIAEIEKMSDKQEHAPFWLSGQQTSASGTVKHNRHVWKSDRGKGLARVPKKQMSRSGDRFVWVGAVIPGTRGGRRAHPPKLNGRECKINRKEMMLGWFGALAMVASKEAVINKYSSLEGKKVAIDLPLIVDSKILSLKAGSFLEAVKKITGELNEVAIQKKTIRPGRGKMRNRKYKKNAGVLLVIGNRENKKVSGIEVIKTEELRIMDLCSNGARLTMFTETAVKELEDELR